MCLAPAAAAAAMEMEEIQEADVLWPDHHQDHRHCHGHHQQLEAAGNKQPRGDAPGGGEDDARRRAAGSSAPVGIRAGTTGPPSWAWSYDGDEHAAAFVPPHVLLAARRRCSEGRAASSVCVGQGRTLKGRDLQSVRTAVLRMTGFLET
ncbi:hypothetical protein SETIT_3G176700v2 [Setaria italica]|uniref:Uncharacterized protein n=2 Tax=Setaria italica TaxID=4555 RepID=A0A368QG08_SETIT|nr:uncharacterized protein LOC101759984 [Setaria italica]RCV16917.1 hypothetical protein SETIT_3G176700v2 [Setaria italica]